MVFADNCCSDQGTIKEVFGNIDLKLDSFHAKQRILRTLKKGSLAGRTRIEFLRQLKLFLRRKDDCTSKIRCKETPSTEEVVKSLRILRQNFIQDIPTVTKQAIKNLMKHAKLGCLR